MNTPYAGFANCSKCSKSFYAIPANGRKVRGKWVCNDHRRPTKEARDKGQTDGVRSCPDCKVSELDGVIHHARGCSTVVPHR